MVTGGAGYIGSHTVLSLREAGYEVVILDNLVYGHRDLVDKVLKVELIVGDIADRKLLDQIFKTREFAAVMHFAAYAYVGESVNQPAKYYRNNVASTLTLLQAIIDAGIKNFVFSSTCATYGVLQQIPVTENQPKEPINPYGRSKLMIENILDDFEQAYGLRSVRFRYFNAAGADPKGCLGEDHTPETHIIPLILLTAMGKRESISIYGTDYDTPDGTCIRDFIHVTDIAQGHILGLEYLLNGGKTEVFNLGNGRGFSIQEVIEAARLITGRTIPVTLANRRPGDPFILVGCGKKAKQILGWQPQYPDLETILKHAWQWHQKRHQGI